MQCGWVWKERGVLELVVGTGRIWLVPGFFVDWGLGWDVLEHGYGLVGV